MAIIKQMVDKTKRLYEYHRIESIRYSDTTVIISLVSYKDHDARTTDADPIRLKAFIFNKSQIDPAQPDRPQIYELIKALPEFSGAVDA